jgi:ribonucleotide reductase beta subunit family protein with ferritin-like domain
MEDPQNLPSEEIIQTDPILTANNDRYVMFPIQDNEIWSFYKKSVDCFWVPTEIDFSKDLVDWNDKLNNDERYFISMVLGFFSASDGIIVENLAVRFLKDVQMAEARAFYGFQLMMENIHSETYSIMIDTFIKDKDEQTKLFKAVENFPCIAKKANWAKKWIADKKSNFPTRLVAFAIVESLMFSSSFAAIYWIKKRGLMPGLTFSNELISRDEAMHGEFAVVLYSKLQKKISKKKIIEIIKEAVEIEKEFILEAIPCRLIGMNSKLMSQYIEFVSDRLALQLGCDKIFNSANPFDFMELISIESKVNFFERTNSEYALANKTIDDNIFDLDASF